MKTISSLIVTCLTIAVVGALALHVSPVRAAEPENAGQEDPMLFARGAQAWANNCARCHNMRDPKELRDDQWRAAMAHMRVRAGLTGKEQREILAFLQGSN